jgi:hypothetical protein
MECFVADVHGLGPLASSESELTFETMNPFTYFCRTPWTGVRPIARPLPQQDSTTQTNVDIHPYLKRDSNPHSECSSGPRHYGIKRIFSLVMKELIKYYKIKRLIEAHRIARIIIMMVIVVVVVMIIIIIILCAFCAFRV